MTRDDAEPGLDPAFAAAVDRLRDGLRETDVTWALTGSTSFALQGVPVDPNDVDVQTTEAGAYAIEERFQEHVVDPVSFEASPTVRSHLGELEIEGVPVEVMGALRKRREDGTWESPVDVESHVRRVTFRGEDLPVLSLAYEARAYERLGRHERAALLREHVE